VRETRCPASLGLDGRERPSLPMHFVHRVLRYTALKIENLFGDEVQSWR
jgi:hypothetical protein